MKFSLTSFGLVGVSLLFSLVTETVATPGNQSGSTVLDRRGPPSRSPGAAAGAQTTYDKFLAYLKSPPGVAASNICFWSGSSGGASVSTKLPDLSKKTGCQYTGALLTAAGISQADSNSITITQWAAISRQLATNARGKAKVLLGETIRPDAIWYVDEYPILQDSVKKGLVSSIELWRMDAKGALIGPAPYVAPK